MTPKYHLRPATHSDAPAIRSLIRQVGINPFGLDWRHFILAVDARDHVIGCGQVKTHRDGSRELASIAVQPAWRLKGVASSIISRLLEEHPGTLYLTCRQRLGKFYEKFGFQVVRQRGQMPAFFRRVDLISSLLKRLGLFIGSLLVMVRPEQKNKTG